MMALQRTIFRYRTFFLFGLLILSLQLYIAVKFFALHTSDDVINAGKFENKVRDDLRLEFFDENSANRVKDDVSLDDEDNHIKLHLHDSAKRSNKSALLHIDELHFTPQCNILSKDAVSAIHRATSQTCKQYIANITCLIQSGELYPAFLENLCPHADLHSGRALGCYQDDKTFRLLNGYYANYKNTNSPEHCIRMCLQSGFVYAGVQYSTECFCGNDHPVSSARLPDPSCNMKCPANPRKACGGYFTINIFETGIAAFTPQQAELKLTDSYKKTKSVRIAYLLTLNGRALRQVRRLIKALFHRDHYFYIHVDARQDYLYRELLPLENSFPNIILSRKRFATIWGGASLLKMLLNSMRELLSKDWKWDFIINLSESDFPVKTNDKLVDFLTANRNKNFVKSHGREVQRFIQKQGLDKTFIECDAHMWRIGDRQLPWGIQIDGGSDWVALSRPFITYVTNATNDKLVQGLLKIFNFTLLPAESFFHTVLRNSQFCNTYIDNNLHVTNWKRKLGCKCQYKHVVDWCGCSPNDFKPDDWQRILATENKQLYFARKFEPVVNQAVILQLEEWLFGALSGNLTNIHSYWQSLLHYADLSPASDEATYTIAHSLLRIISKDLEKCSINKKKLIEVTSFFQNDLHKGLIISFDLEIVNSTNQWIRMESFIKYQSNILINKNNNNVLLLKRLKTFYVSSDYDQKEQISRNFGRFLSPFSEPVLIYEFLPNINSKLISQNVTIIWLNPLGQVVDVAQVHIDFNYVVNYLKLGLKHPYLPGVWQVKLLFEGLVLAQSSFLITPLEFIKKTPLTKAQATITHGGNNLIKKFDKKWNKFGKLEKEKQTLSVVNSKRTGIELQNWIDELVSKFYKVQSLCTVKRFSCTGHIFELCSETVWSTHIPDPKSDISLVDNINIIGSKR